MKAYKIGVLTLLIIAATIWIICNKYESRLKAKDMAYKLQIHDLHIYYLNKQDSLLNAIDSINFITPSKLNYEETTSE